MYVGGHWKDKLFIKVTPSERKIFDEVFSKVRAMYLRKKKELEAQLQGYITGFLDNSYPISPARPVCPNCSKYLDFNKTERRYQCDCGYKGKRLKIRCLDASSYLAGEMESGKFIE